MDFDFAPDAAAARGQTLRQHGEETWPDVYDLPDAAHLLVQDVVHARLLEVAPAEIADAAGSSLGMVAADVIVDRTVQGVTSNDDIWKMTAGLERPFGKVPRADAERGAVLLRYADQQWGDAYREQEYAGNFSDRVVMDVVHAALSGTPFELLPDAIGSLVGAVARDVVTARSGDVDNLSRALVEAVQNRHYGGDEW